MGVLGKYFVLDIYIVSGNPKIPDIPGLQCKGRSFKLLVLTKPGMQCAVIAVSMKKKLASH